MHRNSALIDLGFSAQDRVVIPHTDDLGTCHAANAAFAGQVSFGLLNENGYLPRTVKALHGRVTP